MDWAAFFEAAGLGWQPVVVAWQPSAVKGVASLVASRPLESWKDYLRFHVIHQSVDVLPRAFAEAAADMRRDGLTRDARALATTQLAMADAIGRAVCGALLPVRPEGARPRHRRQRRDGVPRARGPRGVAVAGQPAGRAGQARSAVRRHRLSGSARGLERSSHRRHRRVRQRAAPGRPHLSSCAGAARPAVRSARVGVDAADRRRGPELSAERLPVRGGAPPAAEVRRHRVRCRDLRGHRRDHRPRHEPLRRRAGGGLRAGRPDAPLVDGRRCREVRGGGRADRAAVLGLPAARPVSTSTAVSRGRRTSPTSPASSPPSRRTAGPSARQPRTRIGCVVPTGSSSSPSPRPSARR